MNKTNLVIKVSEISGVDINNCKRVLDAFEEVLGDELSNSDSVGNAFDKIYKMMDSLKKRKDSKN